MSIPTLEQLLATEVSSADFAPVPVGIHNAVITGAKVAKGPKGNYINVEATIHAEGLEGRKVWGISSFSDKALSMPGGPANLLQAAGTHLGTIPTGLGGDETVGWIAQNIIGVPLTVDVEHEQAQDKAGNLKTANDGTPIWKARTRAYGPASDEFAATIEKAAQGLDDDLPF